MFALLAVAFLAAPPTDIAFDGQTLHTPPGWKSAASANMVSFEKVTGATYGQIAYYKGRAATAGATPDQELDAEWADLVTKTLGVAAPEKRTAVATAGGVPSLSASSSKVATPSGTTVWLYVFLTGVDVASVRATSNDAKTFKPAIDAFVAGLRFVAAAAATPVAVAAVPSADVSADPSKIPGLWKRSVSAANTSQVYWDPSYIRMSYDFRADGTYVYARERWQKITPDDFWFMEETGSWKIDGATLVVSPKKSTTTVKAKDGTVKKTQANALEEVRYAWHFRFFSGIGETDLVLKPPKQTERDLGFASNDLEPQSYLFAK